MKKLFALFIVLITSLTNINNAFSISPDVFIQSTVNRASQLLSKDLTKEEKMSQLKLIAKETVDIRGIGFYSLGAARKSLDESQKKIYSNLFEKYVSLIEKILIKTALENSNGKKIKAANLLQIGRNTISRKISELDIKFKNEN